MIPQAIHSRALNFFKSVEQKASEHLLETISNRTNFAHLLKPLINKSATMEARLNLIMRRSFLRCSVRSYVRTLNAAFSSGQLAIEKTRDKLGKVQRKATKITPRL